MAITMCGPRCTFEQKNGMGGCGDPIITYDGAVLETWEENHHDDSDFVAAVWDAEDKAVVTVGYATTRGWTYHNSATVDATREIKALAQQWAVERWNRQLMFRAERESVMPTKGRMVKSTTKRGKNVGIAGKVMWYGKDQYKSSRWLTLYRVGLKVEGEEKLRYLSADSVEVIDPTPIDVADIRKRAEVLAGSRNLHSAILSPLGSLHLL